MAFRIAPQRAFTGTIRRTALPATATALALAEGLPIEPRIAGQGRDMFAVLRASGPHDHAARMPAFAPHFTGDGCVADRAAAGGLPQQLARGFQGEGVPGCPGVKTLAIEFRNNLRSAS
jgi:hypothetical protein